MFTVLVSYIASLFYLLSNVGLLSVRFSSVLRTRHTGDGEVQPGD